MCGWGRVTKIMPKSHERWLTFKKMGLFFFIEMKYKKGIVSFLPKVYSFLKYHLGLENIP